MVYLAALLIVTGIALFVAAPLSESFLGSRRERPEDVEIRRLDRERDLAVQALRELEFDLEMGKVSSSDYEAMRVKLEQRALEAMSKRDELAAGSATPKSAAAPPANDIPDGKVARLPRSENRTAKFCPHCGKPLAGSGKFCVQCGGALTLGEYAAVKNQ